MTFISTYNNGSIRGWQSSSGFPSFTLEQELLPNISANPNVVNFGSNVDLSYNGNYLVVGSDELWNPGTPGNAYIYVKNLATSEFDFQQSITPNNYTGNVNWSFGTSVAVDAVGATVIAGASGYNSNVAPTGTAYVFNRTGSAWAQEAQLLPADANAVGFGRSVAMNYSGNLVAIGSDDNQTASQSGAVFVFTKSANTWTKIQKLKASNIAAGQDFGSSIAITNDQNANYIVVGAPGDSSSQGAIYIFNKSGNTYVQQQRIQRPTSVTGSNFGRKVAINDDGNIIAVGCPDLGITTSAGRVFVYTRSGNTWGLFQTITSSITNNNDAFGTSISLSATGNALFVGDYTYPISGNTIASQGAVFAFEQISSYVETQILTANNAANNDVLGTSVVCDAAGVTIATGAPGANLSNTATDTGAVYIFNS